MDHPPKKGTHGEYYRSCMDPLLHGRDHSSHAATVNNQIIDGLLKDQKIRLSLKSFANCLSIELTIRLCSSGSDCRTFTGIQYSEVNPCFISGFRHEAAHGINFPHEMTLAYATDGRVARHLAKRFDILCNQKRVCAGTGRGRRGFTAGVTSSYHNDIEILHVVLIPFAWSRLPPLIHWAFKLPTRPASRDVNNLFISAIR